MWIQTGVTVRKRLSWVVTSVTLTFDLWPWPFAWTLRWSLVITPENFKMIRWWEHSQKGVTDRRTDGRTDRQTENTICRAAWSQLKTIEHLFYATSIFVHHFIAICKFKLDLHSGNAQIGDNFIFTSVTFTLDLCPWPFAWTSLLSMAITPENFIMIWWHQHWEKGVTDGRADGQKCSSLRAAWSQLKQSLLFIASGALNTKLS